jgi:hypothetical protein
MLLSSNSTDNLLNSFPMFGHPGISALEYAGQVDAMREEKRLSEIALKRKSEINTQDQNTNTPDVTGTEKEVDEDSPPLHFIDEFGCQQRKRGTFMNHTPRSFEMRSSHTLEVYRPSRAESENYSRPLSRQSSMAGGSPATTGQHGHSSSINSGTFGNRSTLNHNDVAELDSTEIGLSSSPEVYVPSTKSHRRSLSAPPSRVLTYQPGVTSTPRQPSRELSFRGTSLPNHHPQEKKRQRRQTPFKLNTSKHTAVSRHAPLEPLVAEHRRKEKAETIGDVPVDMDREVSAEMGTFGVIQRYFDSQGGGPVSTPKKATHTWSTSASTIVTPTLPGSSLHKSFMNPIADYNVDELKLPEDPPPVPSRSPKRMTNQVFPINTESQQVRDDEFEIAAEGEYSPYDTDRDVLHVAQKRTPERHPVGQVPWVGSSAVGRLAPPILGHDAITASADLCLNDLSYYLRNTGPKLEPQPMTKEQKKTGMRLFKVKQRNSLATRFGSVEGSPQRARNRPAVPSCAKEMTTSGGARHLRIVIPTETPTGSQATTLSMASKRTPRRSRHIAISFTDEMLNPLASPEVERMISNFETPDRSASVPVPRSPRSPKRSPISLKPTPVKDHPLASRDEATRARKLRDLQRIKQKPVPTDTCSNHDACDLPTPAQTPEPTASSTFEDEGVAEDSPVSKMERLQDRVITLQRQNTQLAEALAKIVGLELEDGDLRSEDVLDAFRRIKDSRALSIKGSVTE